MTLTLLYCLWDPCQMSHMVKESTIFVPVLMQIRYKFALTISEYKSDDVTLG